NPIACRALLNRARTLRLLSLKRETRSSGKLPSGIQNQRAPEMRAEGFYQTQSYWRAAALGFLWQNRGIRPRFVTPPEKWHPPRQLPGCQWRLQRNQRVAPLR